jgi:OOP family OmpA-OmpF porin
MLQVSGHILLFSVLLASTALAQTEQILTQGRIIDSRTGRGIKANIQYSSIPTGSINGKFNDSTYSFPIFGTAKYRITAEAQGYNPRTIIVDPQKSSSNQEIRDIELIPKGETIRLNHLIFGQGKSTIASESYAELDELVQMMDQNSRIVIQLEGHTDNQGNAKANIQLSKNRVEAVKKYLVSKGIARDRIKTKAFGGAQPLRNEMTPEDRVLNRRVEVRILKD